MCQKTLRAVVQGKELSPRWRESLEKGTVDRDLSCVLRPRGTMTHWRVNEGEFKEPGSDLSWYQWHWPSLSKPYASLPFCSCLSKFTFKRCYFRHQIFKGPSELQFIMWVYILWELPCYPGQGGSQPEEQQVKSAGWRRTWGWGPSDFPVTPWPSLSQSVP